MKYKKCFVLSIFVLLFILIILNAFFIKEVVKEKILLWGITLILIYILIMFAGRYLLYETLSNYKKGYVYFLSSPDLGWKIPRIKRKEYPRLFWLAFVFNLLFFLFILWLLCKIVWFYFNFYL